MKRKSGVRGFSIAAFAIALAAFLIAAGGIWYSLHQAALADRASLHDRESAKEVEYTGEILESGRMPLPEFVKDFSRPPDDEFVSPVATAVLDGRPTFRWKPVDGGSQRIRVSRLDSSLVAESGEVSGKEWTPETDLAPGITYQWQIVTPRGTIPQTSANAPRFRVVDAATSARLRDLAEKRGGVHLLLAIEYGKAGLVEDAKRELNEELKTTRHAEAIERLLGSLNR
ncbi:MAG TPA: hypothetical protein VKT81_15485 [Bryobacteraceae bacterium]|nr:hypothetical protein [Bryobacteraceae bacterium]